MDVVVFGHPFYIFLIYLKYRKLLFDDKPYREEQRRLGAKTRSLKSTGRNMVTEVSIPDGHDNWRKITDQQ